MLQEVQELVRSQISVVRLTVDDWLTLRDLRLRALDDSPESFLGDLAGERDYSRNRWRQDLDHNDWFMATLDARQIGLVKLNRSEDPHDGMHLEALWVEPAIRRRGVGQTLVSAAENAAAAMGVHHLKLWIFVNNHTARDFYLRLGYTGPLRRQSIKANGRVTFEKEYQKYLDPTLAQSMD
jgi:GNAT superfamily N-acetyltransferase